MTDDEPDADDGRKDTKTWEFTDKAHTLFCPECSKIRSHSAVGNAFSPDGQQYCEECSIIWNPAEFDNCVDCGKPLGSTDMRCYSCIQEWKDE
jgi:hypothetical protein